MKSIFTITFLWVSTSLVAQQPLSSVYSSANSAPTKYSAKHVNFNGQWRGSFNELTPNLYGFVSNIRTTYVLDLFVDGSQVSGSSYTYFVEGLKRYFTICRLVGTLDRKSNYLEVTEVERLKYNTPPDMHNCFQTHRLHYEKGDGSTEYLRGDWLQAPGQTGDCGHGETLLSRTKFTRSPFGIRKPEKKEDMLAQKRKPVPPKVVPHAAPKPSAPEKTQPLTKAITSTIPHENQPAERIERDNKPIPLERPGYNGYENRKSEVVRTIILSEPTFHLKFYDNGEIDGDSISVFYNGKLILSHQRLSDTAISLTLTLDKNVKENVVTMYADNLGTIPPNTAVMIVTAGDKRYEVRLESDLGKSGSVIFKSEN